MSDTAEMAAGFATGTKTYQVRAREALPILVRQATAHQTILYGQLALEMGMNNPRTLNYPLGAVGTAMLDLGQRWGRPVPPIQALVMNKSSGLPGEGIALFAPSGSDFKTANRRDRRLIVDRMLQDVFTFPDWDAVLGHFSLSPAPVVDLPPAKTLVPKGGGGEGVEHRMLKEALSRNPQWVGLSSKSPHGELEHPLLSGDSIDVLFAGADRLIAAEVKGASAPSTEVVRGLFQCVKYEAVLNAEARATGSAVDCEAVLALGGPMPSSLIRLRHTLGVQVFDNLDTSDSRSLSHR